MTALATPDEIAALLVYPPILVRSPHVTEWERQFCATIIRQNRSGRFVPSRNQVRVLRGLVKTFRAKTMRDDAVIE